MEQGLEIMPNHVVQVAPVGDNLEAIFISIREFPTRKIVLVSPRERMPEAKKLEERLKVFRIPIITYELKGDLLEGMFEILANLKKVEGDDDLLVNVATGDRLSTCAALSAAYVNGVKAIGVVNDTVMPLPMLRFSFEKLLSEKKMEVLRTLVGSAKGSMSFDELAKKIRVSSPLLSYHLNGDRESSGLIEMGLVEVREEERGGKMVLLTHMGRLIVRGLVEVPNPVKE